MFSMKLHRIRENYFYSHTFKQICYLYRTDFLIIKLRGRIKQAVRVIVRVIIVISSLLSWDM